MPYTNPVIPGFYPDPSVCRVGDDYYLVTSTFEYFPGVPVFHSRDLVHWQQISHCLTRDDQLPLGNTRSSGGIYAPTIRYHNGVFYMVTTNVTEGKHFYVTTTDPRGEWSAPFWIDRHGIDPSLFFDDDGTVYFSWTQHNAIYQSEIDITTGALLTPDREVWSGTGGRYPEAPHLYKIRGTYYLLLAEGGTEYGHMVTIARAESPWGPFEPCPHNPILTHRNRGGHLIQATGHADLFEAHDGSWWAVFLAFRTQAEGVLHHHLGRETFLAPVTWDANGWPVVGFGGTVEAVMDVPTLPTVPVAADPARDDFDAPTLRLCWNFLRNPSPEMWSLTARPGWLRLYGTAHTLNDLASPAFVGRRQQHGACHAAALLDFTPGADTDEAGLTALMNEAHHYEIGVTLRDGVRCVIVRRRIGDLVAVVAQEPLPAGPITLMIDATMTAYTFSYAAAGQAPRALASGATQYLSSETAGGFTGVYLGMYATGNGTAASAPVDFDWFEYTPVE